MEPETVKYLGRAVALVTRDAAAELVCMVRDACAARGMNAVPMHLVEHAIRSIRALPMPGDEPGAAPPELPEGTFNS